MQIGVPYFHRMARPTVLILAFIMSFQWLLAQQHPVIIYVGDPMCSWCYGFAPEITKVKEAFPDHDFKLVLGGLRPHGTETMSELGDFLKHHWEEVSKRSGQPFSYGILSDKNFVYDTEPACRAVVAARQMNPDVELAFFKAVQTLFYVDNRNTGDVSAYLDLAQQFELDTADFKTRFESEEVRYETAQDFQLASEMGVRGFPSVVIRHNGQLFMVANGYMTSTDLIKRIEKVISEG